ncbi:hypothetical protein D8L93_09555 [Sodalis-like symbiont of Bactericera trigonica]|nr:hypothetical protein D8L93_09555 [Sodalis-like symbiont of Bactericera trigonica]
MKLSVSCQGAGFLARHRQRNGTTWFATLPLSFASALTLAFSAKRSAYTLKLLMALSLMVSAGMTFEGDEAGRYTDLLTVVPGQLFWAPEIAFG